MPIIPQPIPFNIGSSSAGGGAVPEKAKIEWDTPLNNATQSDGILTKNAGGNSWTNCCNFSGDTETYAIGTNAYEFNMTSVANATSTGAGTDVQGVYLPVSVSTTTGYRAWGEEADSGGITFELTQWSVDNWGEDIIANRRGNGIYYYDID